MIRKKKRRSSGKLTVSKRFEKSRSRTFMCVQRGWDASQQAENRWFPRERKLAVLPLCIYTGIACRFPALFVFVYRGKTKDGLGRPSSFALILPVRFHLQFDILTDTLPTLAVQRQHICQ